MRVSFYDKTTSQWCYDLEVGKLFGTKQSNLLFSSIHYWIFKMVFLLLEVSLLLL
jgi:hypothetical protein